MNTWHQADLGDAVTAWEPLNRLKDAFAAHGRAGGRDSGMAIFIRHDSDRALHCRVTAYFSPAAGTFATLVEATPCPKPARRGLELIAGDQGSWSVLFPGEDGGVAI